MQRSQSDIGEMPIGENMIDEQEATDRFEQLCGGVSRAQELLRVWQNSYASPHPIPTYSKSKEEVFWLSAMARGFSDEQIDAFLDLQ